MSGAEPLLLLAAASSAISAAGAIRSGNAQKASADYSAKLAQQGAEVELQQAGEREAAQRRQASQVLGAQRAALAQSGGGLGGSAADIMQQSSTNAELDALTTRYEGELRARGMQAGAVADQFSGKMARTAGYMQAASSILSGMGNYASSSADAKFRDEMRQKMSTKGTA